jgi:hypothetical protein
MQLRAEFDVPMQVKSGPSSSYLSFDLNLVRQQHTSFFIHTFPSFLYRAVPRNTHSTTKMTNTPSGSKRPHPDSDHPKRPRERDEPRDWRDIHLSTSRPSDSSSSKRDGGHHKLRKDRRDDKRSTRGGGKDRDRRRDERHDRGSARNEDGVKARQGGLPDSGHLKANHTEKENSEREEGE